MNYWVFKIMLERQNPQQSNQTEFVDQVQFLEKRSLGLLNFRDLKKNKNLLPFVILIGFILFFLILIVLRIFLQKNNLEIEEIKEVKQEVETDPLKLRISKLQENLKAHNPTKQSLPFPQVDLEFNIN